jgi:ABC-type polysaccharide/polyol phosphate transport system ATPase subunit
MPSERPERPVAGVEARHLSVAALLPSSTVSTTVGERSATATNSPVPRRPAAISISHLSKSFRLPHERYHTLKERVLHPVRARRFDVLHAVDDVSVEIPVGEFFGIVGRNGSGKSTLLKCLAGIYAADAGEILVRGRLSPFIELGVGFNPELTARDNVIINAIMLGLSRRRARDRFETIVEFAELEEYMDLKLKNYSSGMHVRLAFAVAIQVDADILLIDEVLAVGDAAFQQKCFDEFSRLKAAERTILFVTHDMGAVERFCDRAMLLDHGKVVDIADSTTIAKRYNELNFRRLRHDSIGQGTIEAVGNSPVAELFNVRFESPDGKPIVSAPQGEPCAIRMDVRFHADAQSPMFSIGLFNELGHVAFVAHSHVKHGATPHFRTGDTAIATITFENWLAPGRYHLTATIYRDESGGDIYDKCEDLASILVYASKSGGGVVDLPYTFKIERT